MDRLTAAFEKKFPKEKTELLVKAINFAKSVHADQKRESQEPYYIHPEAVALILLDMDMDADTVLRVCFMIRSRMGTISPLKKLHRCSARTLPEWWTALPS